MISHILLVVSGIATGIVATVGGIGSIVSYPSLLAFGLPPIAANVTNTTALAVLLPSTVAGGRMERRNTGVRVLVLSGLGEVPPGCCSYSDFPQRGSKPSYRCW